MRIEDRAQRYTSAKQHASVLTGMREAMERVAEETMHSGSQMVIAFCARKRRGLLNVNESGNLTAEQTFTRRGSLR